MNRNIYAVVFALGALAVVWVAVGFVGTNALALAMTLVIGGVYAFGAQEIRRFRQATASLDDALAAIPENLADLGEWLTRLHPSLQNPVRLRIEGERIGLPGPQLTPYLLGLLVMLGMLGTFLGMVVTFSGAVFALEGSTDLQAIRGALSAPIKGLGLAFGTSVAGVATSAMLGLLASLARRERAQAAQRLDVAIATSLRRFSFAHQRQETFKALQVQAQALPEVVSKLDALMSALERQNRELNERLTSGQEDFHRDVKASYTELAGAVDRSLKESLVAGARAAGETVGPIAEAALRSVAQEARQQHERLIETTQSQLDTLSMRVVAATESAGQAVATAVAAQEQGNERLVGGMERTLAEFAQTFEERSASLVTAVSEAQARSRAEQAETERQQLEAWTRSLEAIAAKLSNEWQLAGVHAVTQQKQICATLDRTAREITAQAQTNADNTLNEITRLLETAAEAPRAAAAVIGELRQELSASMARDNAMLEERSRIMETLDGLLDAINHASTEQRAAIDTLVQSSGELLDRVGKRFAEKVEAESERMSEMAANVATGGVEMASLGESFGLAVQLFNEANEKLVANLQRIEAAMDKSTARSDEQLAYYVAQAREIIDLSIMAQKEVVEDLRRFKGRNAPPLAEAA